ncbi:MAG: hypothetical protein HYX21_02565 [Candidatus Yanofskybacteria bacterium]|nr:hypothetical protein [Candidatus Yanofskybacteria bacterium]
MVLKKILAFLAFVMLSPPATAIAWPTPQEQNQEEQRYEQLNRVVDSFYNNFESKESNAQDLKDAWELLRKYPDDPYFYDLWASIEWVLLGHELGVGLDKQKNISDNMELAGRAKKYHEIVGQGFKLASSQDNHKHLLAQAILLFSQAKFIYRFEGNLSGLSQADKDTADGIKILKKILKENPDFHSAYFFLGATRYGLASKTDPLSLKRLFVRWKSYTYSELYYFADDDVFNKSTALKWIEKSYENSYDKPWLKKTWLESALLLAEVYDDQREKFMNGGKSKNEWLVLEKEVSLLEKLVTTFPNRSDIARKLQLTKPRLKVLENYFSSKK